MSQNNSVLDEKDWRILLREIRQHHVIPVVGSALVTVSDPGSGKSETLNRHLARKLAAVLGLEAPESYGSLNATARAHLLRGGERMALYDELRELVDTLKLPPSAGLLELTTIPDFDLFIASTPDPFLAKALEQNRPLFRAERDSAAFHPTNPKDLPETLPNTFLYHILGDYNTYPDFAVWDEDYMEFICGLLEKADTLENLFRTLKSRYLLLLGTPWEDWVVRFFLRVARGERLSGRHLRDYLADSPENLEAPMVFFIDRVVGATRIIQGDPSVFVGELARRWRERFAPTVNSDDFLRQMPDDIPPGAIFISYASEDLAAACNLAQGLAGSGVPVWLDKQRLRLGENFERSLEHAVKDSCSYFISVISAVTEAGPNRYFHKERRWAAARQVDGFVFCLPIIIDETATTRLEQAEFANIHRESLRQGVVTPEFVRRVLQLIEAYRLAGRPRG